MINNWLDYKKNTDSKFVFNLIEIYEKTSPDSALIKFLQEKIITSYRNIDFYKLVLSGESEDKIRQYVINQVIPDEANQFDRNVRQGDWGEILAGLIASYFQNLDTVNKLQWKFNKSKSVFGTDLIAFNNEENIKDISYYEVKTNQNPQNKIDGKYISVIAHNSLKSDIESPTESIADFLMRLSYEKGEYEKVNRLKGVVLNPENYNKKFELCFIVEKERFVNEILSELNSLPPQLNPLNVTIVLIQDLGELVKKTWKDIELVLVDKLNEK